MIALLWLALAWMVGWRCLRLLTGDPAALLDIKTASPWPVLLFKATASLWIGLLPLTWLTYLIAWFFAAILPVSLHPLLPADLIVMLAAAGWLVWPHLRRAAVALRSPEPEAVPRRLLPYGAESQSGWATMIRSLQSRASLFFLLPLVLWLLLAGLMMTGTFYQDGTLYRAGISVFSDFAPHTALTSSFSVGRNWPTEYPHFANDGISYHFMFFFLCGNLNYLGLPLDWAINLPSILGLLTFCVLLGLLAVQLTGRRVTYLLAPLLLFGRSSLAFFTYLADQIGQYGVSPALWQAMLSQSTYIGNTANDSWGLWGVNVFANQRHLLPGLSIALIVLFLFLPDLKDGLERQKNIQIKSFLFSLSFWRVRGTDGWRRLGMALLLCLALPYFHGSVLVSLLLILAAIAVFSSNRLAFVIVAVGSVGSALLQSWVFSGSIDPVFSPTFLFGFIAPDKSLAGVLLYLLEMSGILLPLVGVVFWLRGRQRKILLAGFLLPLVFALTISLTPDVTVNHKFLMISFAFCNLYIADLLARLWAGSKEADENPAALGRPRVWVTVLRRAAAIILATVLMITGVQEMIILHNISQRTYAIDSASPLVVWIEQSTAPDAVFVSAPYHYNAFFLSGRAVWLGHSYYAWSSGHDTAGRLKKEQWLLTGCGGDLAAVRAMVKTEDLDYLILDDTLREHGEFSVDEDFFDYHFPVAAEFPQLGNMIVYDLRYAIR